MLSDHFAGFAAFLLFSLFTFVPGYVLGWLLNVLGFRRRGFLARSAISIPLSISVCPILTYLCWRWSSVSLWMAYGATWISIAILLFYERKTLAETRLSSGSAAVLAILAAWVLVATLLMVDLQIGDRAYFPVGAHDYMLRTAITASVTNTGVPPQNPYFFPGRPFDLKYHYFWFMMCSLTERLGGAAVTARHAMIAGTVWCGIGLMALVPLYLRFFQPKGARELERRTLIGIALLSVTGLDIIPTLLILLLGRRLYASVEWWNNEVPAWIHAVLWTPHYIAALVACLTGFLIIQHGFRAKSAWDRTLTGVVGGLAFASATGLGIYVAIVFVVFLVIWLLICLAKHSRLEAAVLCISGIVAFAAAVPFLLELRGSGSATSTGTGFPFAFTVRSFYFAEVMLEAGRPDPGWREPFVNALVLPLNYFLELGLFFVVGVMQWRKMRLSKGAFRHPELCGFAMAATSLLICTFVRSSVISNNDLGWRGILIAQFILLIWAADLWDDGLVRAPAGRPPEQPAARDRRAAVIALLVLGVAGSIYEVSMFRFFPLMFDDFAMRGYHWLSPDHNLGKRTYALRAVYDRLRTQLPQRAIVQHNPNASPGDVFYGVYADRQAAAETSACGVVFGGDPALCPGVIGPIKELFEKPGAVDADHVDRICHDLSIDALIVKDTDKVWADKNSWVWKKQPDLANDYARVFLCGQSKPAPR